MGGWLTIVGDCSGFEMQLSKFRTTFQVKGVPDLLTEVNFHSRNAVTIGWCWAESIPDLYIAEDATTALVLHGVITDFGRFGDALDSQEENAKRTLTLWGEENDSFIKELNGSFSCIFIDKASGKLLTCYSDRFASRSIWYYQQKDQFILGNFPSALAALCKSPPKLNPAGLWSLFHTSRHVGTQALYSGLHCLKACQKGLLDSTNSFQLSEWLALKYDADISLSPQEWGEEIANVLKLSASKYSKICHDPHLFLSGGLDSRIAAASFQKPLTGITLSSVPNAETRIASIVAKVLGMEHKTIYRSPYWYLDTIEPAALISSGVFFTNHTHFIVPILETIAKKKDAEFLLGDLLENFNKHYFNKNDCSDSLDILNILQGCVSFTNKNISRWGGFFNKEIVQSLEAQYNESLTDYHNTLKPLSEDICDVHDLLLRWSNVSITPTYNMITCIWPLAPERNIIFDNDVKKVSLNIPSKLRGQGVLHTKILKELNSTLNFIPDADTFLPPICPSGLGEVLKKIRPILGKIRRCKIPSKSNNNPQLQTSGSWLLLHELCRKDVRYRSYIEKIILDKDIFQEDIFNHREILATWHKYLNGDIGLHFEIMALMSFGSLSRMINYNGIEL